MDTCTFTSNHHDREKDVMDTMTSLNLTRLTANKVWTGIQECNHLQHNGYIRISAQR